MLVVDDRRLLDALDRLLARLEAGCPEDSLSLLGLPVPIDRGQLLALRSAGLLTPEAALAADESLLRYLLGEETAKKISAAQRHPDD